MDQTIACLRSGWKHGEAHRRVALLVRYTGLRISQAVGLLWRDIRLGYPAGDHIAIRAQARGAKKGRTRVVPLHPALAAEMRTWGSDRDGRLFEGTNERWIRAEVDMGMRPEPRRLRGQVLRVRTVRAEGQPVRRRSGECLTVGKMLKKNAESDASLTSISTASGVGCAQGFRTPSWSPRRTKPTPPKTGRNASMWRWRTLSLELRCPASYGSPTCLSG